MRHKFGYIIIFKTCLQSFQMAAHTEPGSGSVGGFFLLRVSSSFPLLLNALSVWETAWNWPTSGGDSKFLPASPGWLTNQAHSEGRTQKWGLLKVFKSPQILESTSGFCYSWHESACLKKKQKISLTLMEAVQGGNLCPARETWRLDCSLTER